MSRSDLSKYKATVRMIWFLNLRQNKTKQTYPSVWWAMWSISRSLIECDIIFKWEFRILIRDGRSGSVTPTDRSKLCACIKRKWWWSEDVNGFFFQKIPAKKSLLRISMEDSRGWSVPRLCVKNLDFQGVHEKIDCKSTSKKFIFSRWGEGGYNSFLENPWEKL